MSNLDLSIYQTSEKTEEPEKFAFFSKAVYEFAKAKEDLLIFEDKLKSIQVPADLSMEIGSFLSFADFFFDGPIADYLVQSRIQKTLEDIDDAITHVESIINSIRLQ